MENENKELKTEVAEVEDKVSTWETVKTKAKEIWDSKPAKIGRKIIFAAGFTALGVGIAKTSANAVNNDISYDEPDEDDEDTEETES